MKDKRLRIVDYIILTIALVALLLLIYYGYAFKGVPPFDLSVIPIVLIMAYSGLNGLKMLLSGRRRLGVQLVVFSVIVAVVTIITRLVMR